MHTQFSTAKFEYLSHAKFVVTDSCHGASFAIIFRKNFIAITNKLRGYSRFKSLAQLFKFEDRLVTEPKRILTDKTLLEPIDYNIIEEIHNAEVERCYKWLENVLNSEKKDEKKLKEQNIINVEEKTKYELGFDVRRCQMVAALLRDYGIKHAVISSGTRHVELVRFLEKNDCFTTYNVVDERSAGFFGLGLAVKLKEPVAVCCTSGTAASNYLSSVSEAFYQNVPI